LSPFAPHFGNIYGQNAKGFAKRVKENEGINITVEEAEFYRGKFFELYPGLSKWHKGSWNLARYTKIEEVRTPYGRRRLIPIEVDGLGKIHRYRKRAPSRVDVADAVKLDMIELNSVLQEGNILSSS